MTERFLTRQEMILLHLLQYTNVKPSKFEMPFAMTQDGIGAASGMSRSHVSNVVGILEEKDMVACIATNPKGSSTRRKAYYLLPQGLERAREIEDHLNEMGTNIEDIIYRPGKTMGGTPNIIKAEMELKNTLEIINEVRVSDNPAKLRSAIRHTNEAVNRLLMEVL